MGPASAVELRNRPLDEANILRLKIPATVPEDDWLHNALFAPGERYTTLSNLTPVFLYSVFKELVSKR
jgi:hypothetical protein